MGVLLPAILVQKDTAFICIWTAIIFDLVSHLLHWMRRVIEHQKQSKLSGKLAINVINVDAKMLILWLVLGPIDVTPCHVVTN